MQNPESSEKLTESIIPVKSYVVTLILSSDEPNYLDCISRINMSISPNNRENVVEVFITWPGMQDGILERVRSGVTIDVCQIGKLKYSVQFTDVMCNPEAGVFEAEVALVGQPLEEQ